MKKAGAALMDLEGSRDELLSRAELGDTAGGAATSNAQRDRLLTAHDQLRKTGDRISEGKKQLLETEELGASILVNLKGQREQIINTRETLHGADDNIGKSRRILTSMARRAMQNKIILGVRARKGAATARRLLTPSTTGHSVRAGALHHHRCLCEVEPSLAFVITTTFSTGQA